MSDIALAWKFARQELCAGVKGFRILIACLVLGVMAISSVASMRESISASLQSEGAVILGGDAELQFTYRFATDDERTWMEDQSVKLSEIADFRSMIVFNDERVLTQVKAVDNAYPLLGSVMLDPPMSITSALEGVDDLAGVVIEPIILDRLGLAIGDVITLGGVELVVMAHLISSPDTGSDGFSLGPRSIVAKEALSESSLLGAGTLFETKYRLLLPEETDLDEFKKRAKREVAEGAFRWRDARNGAPGVKRFIERLSGFLILVGLAGLAVGGIGVSAAVGAYLSKKTAVIATLKTLGASRRMIFMTYFFQLGVISFGAILIGTLLGVGLLWVVLPFLQPFLPVPVSPDLHIRAVLEALLYGSLSAIIFVLWPLSKVEHIRPAILYRDSVTGVQGRPRWLFIGIVGLCVIALIGSAMILTGSVRIVGGAFVGIAASMLLLVMMSWLAQKLAKYLALRRIISMTLSLKWALLSIASASSEIRAVFLSLGIGLTVLSAIGQIDHNMRSSIQIDLPEVAPSYYVVDIQKNQIDALEAQLEARASVSEYEFAPMLRGIITKINGQNARSIAGNHWVLRGDRGVSFSDEPPGNAVVTAGEWWPHDYNGAPQISFAAEEAEEIGLKLGDTMTINILGRDITGTVTSFRDVNFSDAGMGFILSMNSAALRNAPHSYIGTIYVDEADEAALIRDVSRQFPNLTAIRVGDAIDRVVGLLQTISTATSLAAIVTLITGAVVLVGAGAASEGARRYEAAILKTFGASRIRIITSFMLRSAIIGAMAGSVALLCGTMATWSVMHFIFKTDFEFAALVALWIIVFGIVLSVLTSAFFTANAVRVRPARELRARF